jgi:hypothetical protein
MPAVDSNHVKREMRPMAKICAVILDHKNDVYLQDLIDGLRTFCPGLEIAWYNSGGEQPEPGTPAAALPMLPNSRPLRYAKVTPFFFDMLEWAAGQNCDYVVNTETDVAFIQPGYEQFVTDAMRDTDFLAPGFARGTSTETWWRPYQSLVPELPELLQILGLDYTNKCFSPGMVFGSRYIEALLTAPWYADLRAFIARNQDPQCSKSLQEVLMPTLADALGVRVSDYPAQLAEFNRFRPWHSATSVLRALTTLDAYFVHPVRRDEQDEARQIVRQLAAGVTAAAT